MVARKTWIKDDITSIVTGTNNIPRENRSLFNKYIDVFLVWLACIREDPMAKVVKP